MDGWVYESLTTVLAAWARLHTCKIARKLTGVNTPYDGGNVNLRCHEYKDCHDGRVMQCMYDGHHGSWPKNTERLTWWFFS
jgi:hypothetical protein